MLQQEVIKQIAPIFVELFSFSESELKEATSANDIPEWDSLNHAILIDKIEKHFEIKFDLMDVLDMMNVGDICAAVLKKKN